jgi:hypothetical protein
MAGPVTLAGALVCAFTTASIDGRAAFDSAAVARAVPLADAPGLAVLRLDGTPPQLAAVRRDGVWLSLRTAPDRDHGNRVAVLDIAQGGPRAGLAVLVLSDPDSAARIVSREGACRAEERP